MRKNIVHLQELLFEMILKTVILFVLPMNKKQDKNNGSDD